MKIAKDVLQVLAGSEVDGKSLRLPGQLDRKLYMDVNKCLKALGGKWVSAKKAHVFEDDPSDGIDALLLTGELADWKKELQFFPTPAKLAAQICDMAELDGARNILEPSCGMGALADEIYARNQNLMCVEINEALVEKLRDTKPYPILRGDFLTIDFRMDTIDRIVMNPPFSKQRDIIHITRAYELLEEGGILVAVSSPSPYWRDDRRSIAFRDMVQRAGGEVIDVPENAFKESGTAIRTNILKLVKGKK